MWCSESSGVSLGRVFDPGPTVPEGAVPLSLGGEVGVHCEDNSVLVESRVLSPEGNLQSTCEDFEGVSDLTD